MYGVVGVVGPANHALKTYSFPGGDGTVEMGPEGMRIWTLNQELYREAIEDVVLVATLIEHDDFADIEDASRRIADRIAELGGQVVGALMGLPAESATQETWFRDGLAAGVGFVIGDILGMGDDPYPGQSLRVPFDQVLNGAQRQPPRTRDDDPKQIPLWTHRVKVTARADADDFGDYDFYFDLEIGTMSGASMFGCRKGDMHGWRRDTKTQTNHGRGGPEGSPLRDSRALGRPRGRGAPLAVGLHRLVRLHRELHQQFCPCSAGR